MSKHFRAVIATTHPDQNGQCFSEEALRQMVASFSGTVPVTLNFEPGAAVGRATAVSEANGVVRAEGNVVGKLRQFVVPCVIVEASHKDGDVLVIDRCKILSLGTTDDPADEHLTPLEPLP